MHTLILASPRVDEWQAFSDVLKTRFQMEIVSVRSGRETLEAVHSRRPLAVAVDAQLDDLPGSQFVRELLMVDAMIHTALVSDASEADFHEMTEGLGILMPLSPVPTAGEAERLGRSLETIAGDLEALRNLKRNE